MAAELRALGIPFNTGDPRRSETDVVIPGVAQLRDSNYPADKVIALAVKTTCKDRWRQVTQEAPRVGRKYLVTKENRMSEAQAEQIARANIQLVVPKPYQAAFPAAVRPSLWTFGRLVEEARRIVP